MTSDSKLYGENFSSALMEKLFGSRVVAITAIMQQSLCSTLCLLCHRGKTAQSKGWSRARLGLCGRKPVWLLIVGKLEEYNWKHEDWRGYYCITWWLIAKYMPVFERKERPVVWTILSPARHLSCFMERVILVSVQFWSSAQLKFCTDIIGFLKLALTSYYGKVRAFSTAV